MLIMCVIAVTSIGNKTKHTMCEKVNQLHSRLQVNIGISIRNQNIVT